MALVEEETRSRGAIVIKPGGRYVGKDTQRGPLSGLFVYGVFDPMQISKLLIEDANLQHPSQGNGCSSHIKYRP